LPPQKKIELATPLFADRVKQLDSWTRSSSWTLGDELYGGALFSTLGRRSAVVTALFPFLHS